MTSQPTAPMLEDGRVRLRAHRADDAAGVLEQCLDPISREWTTIPLEYTIDDANRFVRHAMPGGWRTDEEWGFAVEADDEDGRPRFAGTISLRNEGERRAEVAYGSHPWVRGHGVMEAALRLLLAWGYAERGLETVIWWANRGNWSSRKLAWRLGFQHEGTPRRWLPQRGVLLDAWVGTLLSTDEMKPATPWLEPPTIAGDQVVLRRIRASDTARIVEGCRDAEVVRWLGQIPQPYTPEHAKNYLAECQEKQAVGQAVTWCVADRRTDVAMGLVNLFGIRWGVDAEVGYWVHPDGRGRGVATEATRLAVRHGFVPAEDGGLGLGRVRALAAEGNRASQGVLTKAGLTQHGWERRALLLGNGSWSDAAVYDVLVSEFR